MFRDLFSVDGLINLLYFLPIFLITITVHECAHGYAAYKMGDPTARNMGRLTLNPLRHIDPIGFLMLMILRFGWAKPVPINPRNFRNQKKGMALSALAGPVSNLLMAILGLIIYRTILVIVLKANLIGYDYASATVNINPIADSALTFFSNFAVLNVYFAVFNLIPVPPLDGSRILTYFLPPKLGYYYNYVERYGFIVLLLLLYPDWGLRPFLQFVAGHVLNWIDIPISWIFSLFGG